jgi:hypothetical protein
MMDRAKARIKKRKKEALNQKKNRAHSLRIFLIAALSALAAGGIGLFVFLEDQREAALYDLSIVGQGQPVIVQVHDENCSICRSLKTNVETVLSDFSSSELIYRIADVQTDEGLEFSSQYTPERWRTLLYFSPSGQLVDVQVGLQNLADLRESFTKHILGQLSALD